MATDLLDQIVSVLDRVNHDGDGFKASCPVPSHGRGMGDRTPSFTVQPGDRTAVVYKCHAGCDQDAIRAALVARGVVWPTSDTQRPAADTWVPCGHTRVDEYIYRDQNGAISFGVTRCDQKDFAQWRPDPASKSGKRWSIKDKATGERLVPYLPYRLPQVLAGIAEGKAIWIVEGEKDAKRLATMGIEATCNNGGAGKWMAEHAAWLKGAHIVICADMDKPGFKHANHVVDTLIDLAASIEVVRAAEGKDVSDHFDAGHKLHQFVTVATPKPIDDGAIMADLGCPDCKPDTRSTPPLPTCQSCGAVNEWDPDIDTEFYNYWNEQHPVVAHK